jgi:hypothetical protein
MSIRVLREQLADYEAWKAGAGRAPGWPEQESLTSR